MLVAVLSLLTLSLYAQPSTDPFWLGADISGTLQLEHRGTQLRNVKGEPRENTALMHELGLNAIRLRVWVNPSQGEFCSPHDVLVMARRAKDWGMPVMIDFHYSDWWADPGQQNIPAAWKEMSYPDMCKALAEHTRSTLQLLKEAKIDVRWVQVGNETTNGFLWPVGKASEQMSQYAGLTRAGYEAVKQVYPQAMVIVHLDCAADLKRYNFIFDGLRKFGCKWDIIGMSVYPYWDMRGKHTKTWQETVDRFADNVKTLNKKYGTQLMVVETGVEREKPIESKQILAAIIDAARHRTDGHCLGVFYWAPELERHYRLGAFTDNRPTAIMEAFTEAAAEK